LAAAQTPQLTQKKRRNWMTRADTAFAKHIRATDCAAEPPHAGNIQCAHIISRSYKTIRTNPDNAVALCAKHHVYFTHHPLEWKQWVDEQYPGRWEQLTETALTYERVNWKSQAEYWESDRSSSIG